MKKNIFFMSVITSIILVSIFSGNSLAQGNKDKVALVMKALTNPFFSKMKIGAQDYAAENQITLEVFGIEWETDVHRQIDIVEDLISREYGAIVIAPADSKELIPVCKKALDNGLVVINIDNPFHRPSLKKIGISIPFVGSNNEEGAAMVGEFVRRKLNGKGRVLVIEGIRGVENADLRMSGFIQAVTKESEIKVIASESANWHTDEAFSLVTQLLGKHGNVDTIFCANDNMAIGALQALDSLDISGKIVIAGYDNIEQVRNAMQHGNIHATVEQHPELMGEYGVRLAKRAMMHEEVPDYSPTPLDLITYTSFGKTIGFSISTLSNPFFVLLQKYTEKAARMHGFNIISMDAHNDEARQLADIEKFIAQKVSALMINPVHSQSVSIAVEMANTAGIPVITVDRKSSDGDILCHIASDNYIGGTIAGKFLADRLGGKGRIVEIEGIPGTSVDHERGKGFNDIISQYPDLKIIARRVSNFDRRQAEKSMQKLLSQNVEFDAVFAHNDNMILGVLEAIEEADRNDLPILLGFDALPEAVEAVNKGRLAATIAQSPSEMGRIAITTAAQFFDGIKVNKFIPVDLKLLSR